MSKAYVKFKCLDNNSNAEDHETSQNERWTTDKSRVSYIQPNEYLDGINEYSGMEDFETTSVGGSSIRSSQATTDSSMTEKIISELDMEDKSDEFNDRVNEKDEAKQKILIADQLLMQRGLTPPAHVKEELHHTNNADSTTAAESAENEDPKTKSQQASDVIKPYVAVEFNHLPGELPQENNDDETDESFALMKDESATNGYVPVQQIADYLVYNERFEVDPRQIKKERRIGEGFYGDVYLGTLSRSKENIQVAIKMAKDEKSVLRDEMKILMYLQSEIEHENVLRLLGAVTKSRNEFCILTEFCEFGSLDSFLERKFDGGEFVDEIIVQENNEQQQLLEQTWKAQQDPSWAEKYRSRRESGMITTSDLLWFALQIARAMQFLAEKKIIHRDVALRNILLKDNFTLKIADFGLSKRLYETDNVYKIFNNGVALPYNYMAIESLSSNVFTIHSECWSFGVVIWELFTFAKQLPYETELENFGKSINSWQSLVVYLSKGHRLTLPSIVPSDIRTIVTELWNEDPVKRPNFLECRRTIRRVLQQACENIVLDESVSSLNIAETAEFHTEEEVDTKPQIARKSKKMQTLRIISLVAVVTAVALAIVIGAFFITSNLIKQKNENFLLRNNSGSLLEPHERYQGEKFIRFAPNAPEIDSRLIYSVPDGNGTFFVYDNSTVVYFDLSTKKQNAIGSLLAQRHSEQIMLKDVKAYSFNLHSQLHPIILTLVEESNETLLLSHIATSKSLLPKNNQTIKLPMNLSSYELRLLKDDAEKPYCIFLYWQRDKSEATVFSVLEINFDADGNIIVADSFIGKKTWKLDGIWTAPYLKSDIIYWALQLTSLKNSTAFPDAYNSEAVAIVALNGTTILMNKTANFYQCPKTTGNYSAVSLWQDPVEIKINQLFYIFYLFSDTICYIDFEMAAWRPLTLNLDKNTTIKTLMRSKPKNGKLVMHARIDSQTPLVITIDIMSLIKERNPYILPQSLVKTKEAMTAIDRFESLASVEANGQAIMYHSKNHTFTTLNLTSKSRASLPLSNPKEMPYWSVESYESNTSVCSISHEAKTYLVMSEYWADSRFHFFIFTLFLVDENSATVVGRSFTPTLRGRISSSTRYFQQDDNGQLYFISYLSEKNNSKDRKTRMFLFAIDILKNNKSISHNIIFNNQPLNVSQGERPFILKDHIYWLSTQRVDDELLKISLKTGNKSSIKFSNRLTPLSASLNAVDIWSMPAVINGRVFFFCHGDAEEDHAFLFYIDSKLFTWHAIKLSKRWFLNPVTLLFADDGKLVVYETCLENGNADSCRKSDSTLSVCDTNDTN